MLGFIDESSRIGANRRSRISRGLPHLRVRSSIAAVVLAVVAGGACTTGTDDATTATPTAGGGLCDELDGGYDASQEPTDDWSDETLRDAAAAEPQQVRDAVDTFAVVVDGLQKQFADADAPAVQVTAEQWQTASNAIAWWQHANCDSRSMSWDIHDPELNPAGLTEAVPLTNDGAPPQHVASETEVYVGADGSVVAPDDVEPKDQQTIMFFADVDRRCFALGRHVAVARNDSTNPGAEAEHLAAANDAGGRKRCLSESATDAADRQVRWTDEYEGWQVRVVEAGDGAPPVGASERIWALTEDLYVVATPLAT